MAKVSHPAKYTPLVEVSDNAEQLGMMMPQWAQTLGDFAREWSSDGSPQDLAKKLRGMLGSGDKKVSLSEWLSPPLRIMQTVVLHGFHLRFSDEKTRLSTERKSPWLPTEAAMLARDLAAEWFLADNAVATWVRGAFRKSGAPAVTVLDTENIAEYTNGFGGERLMLKAPDKAYAASLSGKWKEAAMSGKPVELRESDGDFYQVRNRAKRGKGLARPSLEGALPLIGTVELLGLADRSAAWEHRNIIRQWLIGHDIRYGPRSGMADHFIKAGHVKALKAKLKGKVGPHDLYTNFDWAIKHNFLPTDYFKKEKYEGGLMRLAQWFGPVGRLLREEIKEEEIPLVRAWVDEERSILGGLVEDILNHPAYWGGRKLPTRITVGWSPVTLLTPKMVLELARFASAQGAIGQQTTREVLGFEHERERMRLADEAAKEGNKPNFEQKQGIVAAGSAPEGGRPPEH